MITSSVDELAFAFFLFVCLHNNVLLHLVPRLRVPSVVLQLSRIASAFHFFWFFYFCEVSLRKPDPRRRLAGAYSTWEKMSRWLGTIRIKGGPILVSEVRAHLTNFFNGRSEIYKPKSRHKDTGVGDQNLHGDHEKDHDAEKYRGSLPCRRISVGHLTGHRNWPALWESQLDFLESIFPASFFFIRTRALIGKE